MEDRSKVPSRNQVNPMEKLQLIIVCLLFCLGSAFLAAHLTAPL